jgi:N-acetylglutamate synthase-like GNAT family acetyltransferase
MGALPDQPDSLYLHDLALVPDARGAGAGARATRIALEIAAAHGLRHIYLLAVNGAETYWASHGFAPVADGAVTRKVRATYGDVVYMHRPLP